MCVERAVKSSRRFLAVLGKNPTKVNFAVSNAEQINALNAALAPGIGQTFISDSTASFTKSAPGSEIAGSPASLTQAIFLPSRSKFKIFSPD